MKNLVTIALACILFSCANCEKEGTNVDTPEPHIGSWQLLSSEYIKKDTIISNVVPGQTMIKIITPTHFAFFSHDTIKGVDSTAMYMSGSGSYHFKGEKYVENLEYCTARQWEKNSFEFDLKLKGDTLIQTGIEELEDLGLGEENMLLVEKYLRIK